MMAAFSSSVLASLVASLTFLSYSSLALVIFVLLGFPPGLAFGVVVLGAVVVGVAVEAAVDHVGEAGPPAAAVVGVVVGEHLVLGVDRDVEVVARARGVDLEVRAVGAEADDAAAVELGLRPVDLGDQAVDALVAGGHVEVAVHREADVGGDVVVEVAAAPGGGVVGVVSVDGVLADAGGDVVGEDAELRGVVDVELAVDVRRGRRRRRACRRRR